MFLSVPPGPGFSGGSCPGSQGTSAGPRGQVAAGGGRRGGGRRRLPGPRRFPPAGRLRFPPRRELIGPGRRDRLGPGEEMRGGPRRGGDSAAPAPPSSPVSPGGHRPGARHARGGRGRILRWGSGGGVSPGGTRCRSGGARGVPAGPERGGCSPGGASGAAAVTGLQAAAGPAGRAPPAPGGAAPGGAGLGLMRRGEHPCAAVPVSLRPDTDVPAAFSVTPASLQPCRVPVPSCTVPHPRSLLRGVPLFAPSSIVPTSPALLHRIPVPVLRGACIPACVERTAGGV